ncbi:hypothetical protein MRY87_12360 [bacterium]|nr:hypothetical protein [bacterium]
MKAEDSTNYTDPLKRTIFSVDAFEHGLAFGQHVIDSGQSEFSKLALRLPGEESHIKLRARYLIEKDKPLIELEKQLLRLSNSGVLRRSVIILGVHNDPFHPFEGRFDAAMKFLALFERYTPGLLCIQTRSPLLVLSLPLLKNLEENVVIHFGIETPLDSVARRYTPSLPTVSERVKTVRALSRFGIETRVQVSPLLPYGDWKRDAGNFLELLGDLSCGVDLRALGDGSVLSESKLRNLPLALKLQKDAKFDWLRPDAILPLKSALERHSPELLERPERPQLSDSQMDIFAA